MVTLCVTAVVLFTIVCLFYYIKVVCTPSNGTVVSCDSREYLDGSDTPPIIRSVTSISVAFEHHEELYSIKGKHKIPEGKNASIRLLVNPFSESATSIISVGTRRYIGRKYAIR